MIHQFDYIGDTYQTMNTVAYISLAETIHRFNEHKALVHQCNQI